MNTLLSTSNLARLAALGALFALTATATQVTAQPSNAVQELHLLKGENGPLILAVSANGITFIDPKKDQTFRAFKSKRTAMRGYKPDWVSIHDVDRDDELDIIGVGRPSFIVTSSASPIYNIASGCDQFHVADFTADRALDIVCRKGSSLQVSTYDGQKLWQYKIQGLRLGLCAFGDFNGDNRTDIECKIKGKDAWLRITGDGDDLGHAFDQAALDTEVEDDNPGYADAMTNYLNGETLFDLNGDGTAEEWVKLDGKALVIGTRAGNKAFARHETGPIYSILAQDIDGDGKTDIIAGGQGKVFLFNTDATLRATLVSDPLKLKRKADVVIDAVNANSLENDDESVVRIGIDKAKNKLASCYAGNVKRNPFTRVGRTIWILHINKKGKAAKVERLHSDLNDKKVESCLKKTFKKITFPKAKDADGNVTVTLIFGFLDQ